MFSTHFTFFIYHFGHIFAWSYILINVFSADLLVNLRINKIDTTQKSGKCLKLKKNVFIISCHGTVVFS